MSAGWNKQVLGDVAVIQTGRSNSQDAVPDGPFPLFDRSRVPKRSDRHYLDCEAVIVPGEGREFMPRYYDGPFDLHQRVYALTAFREIDGRFLYYALTAHRAYFAQVATGATVKSLRKGMFERFAFRAPDLPTQRKIAGILSAYDDLIENNLRRIEILEEMARNLYREWFVEFRFPGHERARFVDSAVGRIPEGWVARALEELATIQTGRSNRQDADPDGEFAFFDRSREIKRSNRYLFDCEAVVVPGEGREFVPRYWVGPFDLHQRVYALTDFRGIDGLYLYHAVLANRDYFARVATGATVKSLRKGMFERFPVVVPPDELWRTFSHFAGSAQGQCKALDNRNAILRQARDLLLPKLISGEIDVSSLPVRTPPRAGNGAAVGDDITRYEFFRAIADLPFVDKIVLFGSRARGDHEDRSDIDLAVFCDDASDEDWAEVLACLREDRIDTLRKVDCVRFDECDAVLRENVLSEGVVLYEKGAGA